MLEMAQITRLVGDAVSASLGKVTSTRVIVAPVVDSYGEDALNVLIVLQDEGADAVDGDLALGTLVRINRDLQASGVDRFAFVSYATETDMASEAGMAADDAEL